MVKSGDSGNKDNLIIPIILAPHHPIVQQQPSPDSSKEGSKKLSSLSFGTLKPDDKEV